MTFTRGTMITDIDKLQKMLRSEGVQVAANRQAVLSNGAEKLQVTITFWPEKVEK